VHKAIIEGNVIAMIFYLKTQCGWSEKRRPNLGSKELEDLHTRGAEEIVFKVSAEEDQADNVADQS
jgi:hypothetical protein